MSPLNYNPSLNEAGTEEGRTVAQVMWFWAMWGSPASGVDLKLVFTA